MRLHGTNQLTLKVNFQVVENPLAKYGYTVKELKKLHEMLSKH